MDGYIVTQICRGEIGEIARVRGIEERERGIRIEIG